MGVTHAGVTRGSKGYYWVSKAGEEGNQPAFALEVVDTTGAGDAFHGAFAWAVARGFSTPECARIAAAVSALKCRRLGARSGLPTLGELKSFLAAQER
jgi:sulfofructose kinase